MRITRCPVPVEDPSGTWVITRRQSVIDDSPGRPDLAGLAAVLRARRQQQAEARRRDEFAAAEKRKAV